MENWVDLEFSLQIQFKCILVSLCDDCEWANELWGQLSTECGWDIKVLGAECNLIPNLEVVVPAVFVSLGLLTGLCFQDIGPC
jgi:hypothetical protein